ELYAASRAGVEIDLIVRGICCLRPGVPGLSERIRVRSIVDRYLEHARIFFFANAGEPEYLLASADWMPRNLDHRLEIAFPVLSPALQAKLREVLETQLADNVKARIILSDGHPQRVSSGGPLRAGVAGGAPAAQVAGAPLRADRGGPGRCRARLAAIVRTGAAPAPRFVDRPRGGSGTLGIEDRRARPSERRAGNGRRAAEQ